MGNNANRPGLRTTEFWVTGAANVVGLLVLAGVVNPEDVSGINEAVAQIASAVAIGITNVGYILGRTLVKKEEIRTKNGG